MKRIKALHLASFDGNIGDNANHAGFYAGLGRLENYEFSFEPLEIREFYWKQRFFDDSFVELVNSYDMLVVGGGNYFELWVDHSPTGTSFMLEPALFKQIKIPVLFNALGVDPGQGASDSACNKFRFFLDEVFSDPKNMVSVRNDGALQALEEFIGTKYAERCFWTPDAGCLFESVESVLNIKQAYLAVNLAGDMLDLRFGNSLTYEQFLTGFSGLLERYVAEEVVEQVVFVPHIFRDLSVISDLLELMDDSFRRRFVTVAPLLHGAGSEKVLSIYGQAEFSLCTRFHANLCSIAQATPTVGLVTYRQIVKLYEELSLEEFSVTLDSDQCFEKIWALTGVFQSKNGKNIFQEKSSRSREEYLAYIENIGDFLNKNFTV